MSEERDPVFKALLDDNDRTFWIAMFWIAVGFVPALVVAIANAH